MMLKVFVSELSVLLQDQTDEELLKHVSAGHSVYLKDSVGTERYHESAAADLLLQQAVRRIVPFADPATWSWKCGPHGKPEIPEIAPLRFNLSHSSGVIACAVSDREVGIDVERKTAVRSAVVRRWYTPAQKAEVMSADDPDLAFTRIWTRWEAILKWNGRGLSREYPEEPEGLRTAVLKDGLILTVCSEEKWDGVLNMIE